MKPFMSTLLATEALAQQYGCRLKPELRAAIEADLRFPAHAASPVLQSELTDADLPENVVRFDPMPPRARKATA